MAHSLEVRVPILDHKFVEWGFRVPTSERIVEGEGKAVFKKALRNFLPDETLDRSKKGFDVPTISWLRNELADDTMSLGESEIFADSGLFNIPQLWIRDRSHSDFCFTKAIGCEA